MMQLLALGKNVFGETKYARVIKRETFINEIIDDKTLNKYILIDKIFKNNELEDVKEYVIKLYSFVDGFIFSDLGILNILKKINLEDKLVYNPNTLLTNYEDFNFYAEQKIKGAFISPFIPLNDLEEIVKRKKCQVFFQGYGNLNMMYSRRLLLKNYTLYKNIDYVSLHNNFNLYLKEEMRGVFYPVVENDNGTNIYTDYCFQALDYLDKLKDIDYLYLDTTFQSEDIYKTFDDALKNDKNIEIKNSSTGFLNKKTIYKVNEK